MAAGACDRCGNSLGECDCRALVGGQAQQVCLVACSLGYKAGEHSLECSFSDGSKFSATITEGVSKVDLILSLLRSAK